MKLWMILVSYQRSALRSNLEKCPSWRGDYHHATMLPGREISKKAQLGCCIYWIKWLAHSQIICGRKGMHEDLCTHNFLWCLKHKSWKKHLPFICLLHDQSSKPTHMHQCLLHHFAPLWVIWRSLRLSLWLPLEPVPNHWQSGQGGQAHLSQSVTFILSTFSLADQMIETHLVQPAF